MAMHRLRFAHGSEAIPLAPTAHQETLLARKGEQKGPHPDNVGRPLATPAPVPMTYEDQQRGQSPFEQPVVFGAAPWQLALGAAGLWLVARWAAQNQS